MAIIWNTTLTNEFTAARDHVCQKYCPQFRAGHAGKRSVSEGDEFLRHHYFKQVEFVKFDNHFSMDMATFEGNMRSRSYALRADHPEYENFMLELREVFQYFAINNIVTEPQETQIYLGGF